MPSCRTARCALHFVARRVGLSLALVVACASLVGCSTDVTVDDAESTASSSDNGVARTTLNARKRDESKKHPLPVLFSWGGIRRVRGARRARRDGLFEHDCRSRCRRRERLRRGRAGVGRRAERGRQRRSLSMGTSFEAFAFDKNGVLFTIQTTLRQTRRLAPIAISPRAARSRRPPVM